MPPEYKQCTISPTCGKITHNVNAGVWMLVDGRNLNAFPQAKHVRNARGKSLNDLSIEWVEQFWRSTTAPKFVYSHFDMTHDAPNLAALFDNLVLGHLRHMVQQENTVTIVMGDHGQPRGPYKELQRFPFLSVTLSNDLAKQPGWKKHRETLQVNTHRLLAHKDMYVN